MSAPDRAVAVLRQRCPKCRQGPVFRGWIAMHPTCPVCGHRFEREPGYFTGAMYVSYALAVPTFAVLFLLVRRILPRWSDTAILPVALLPFLLFVPVIVRYSRVIWMHLDWTVDPDR
jgi:uncharacterized protein (DUF983 family)